MQVWSLDQEDPLEKEMAAHSDIFAWEIPWTEDPGRIQFMRSQNVRHNLATKQQWQDVSVADFPKTVTTVFHIYAFFLKVPLKAFTLRGAAYVPSPWIWAVLWCGRSDTVWLSRLWKEWALLPCWLKHSCWSPELPCKLTILRSLCYKEAQTSPWGGGATWRDPGTS